MSFCKKGKVILLKVSFRNPKTNELLLSQEAQLDSGYALHFFDFMGSIKKSLFFSEPKSLAIKNSDPSQKISAANLEILESTSLEDFSSDFQNLQADMKSDKIEKAVMFVDSKLKDLDFIEQDLFQLWSQSSDSLYGLFVEDENFQYMGLSPEILFYRERNKIKTFALAGTRTLDESFSETEFLENQKERKEHQLVVKDIAERLSQLGRVELKETFVKKLKHLAHLKTEIELSLDQEISDRDLVEFLHPTAALGTYPRKHQSNWYREYLQKRDLGVFGAPILVQTPDYSFCVVGIRCLYREANQAWFLRAGAGIVSESEAKTEFEEMKAKQLSVLRNLGAL